MQIIVAPLSTHVIGRVITCHQMLLNLATSVVLVFLHTGATTYELERAHFLVIDKLLYFNLGNIFLRILCLNTVRNLLRNCNILNPDACV